MRRSPGDLISNKKGMHWFFYLLFCFVVVLLLFCLHTEVIN